MLTLRSEIRGLHKRLVTESEAWNGIFRDPWTEALPILNPNFPFLTDREGYMSHGRAARLNLIHRAIECHQTCARQPPVSDDGLCFHITFYEIIDVSVQNSPEHEFWKSGPLHSENEIGLFTGRGSKRRRRIRESACTVRNPR